MDNLVVLVNIKKSFRVICLGEGISSPKEKKVLQGKLDVRSQLPRCLENDDLLLLSNLSS